MSFIYLDNAATTKPLPSIGEIISDYGESAWYNPSALYGPAVDVRRKVEHARETLSRSFGSGSHQVLFTSGGTEAANMAVRFGARRRRNQNFVCGGFEHPCVEESFLALREQGEEVRFVPVRADGSVSKDALLDAVDENTVLVSVIHVSNETGAVNDIGALARAVKARAPRAMFHSDGVQAFLRVPVRDAQEIDYYTVSAHKLHGLKGTGAVFYLPRTPLKAMMRGGGHEKGLRSGTENVPGILAFEKAAGYFAEQGSAAVEYLKSLHDRAVSSLAVEPNIRLISPEADGAPHIVVFSVSGVRGETLMHSLEKEGTIIAVGSACSSKKGRSRAARALGVSEDTASGMIRLSFSPFTTAEEVDLACRQIAEHAATLRK